VLWAQNKWEAAIPEFETALAADPNSVWLLHYLAIYKLLTGSTDEVIPLEERAIRLSRANSTSVFGMSRAGPCICCNRAPTKRSPGSKKRAAFFLPHRSFISASLPLRPVAERFLAQPRRGAHPVRRGVRQPKYSLKSRLATDQRAVGLVAATSRVFWSHLQAALNIPQAPWQYLSLRC
jgi:hypothetical protein